MYVTMHIFDKEIQFIVKFKDKHNTVRPYSLKQRYIDINVVDNFQKAIRIS